ncbi:TetR/AcrR family transcriptional regulator [Streptacidiphilus melanogenes]|uniref:TetR/AcrR family transcriptional regulator n=1 Tax=Streptacidiphilus melanogenes TaxID=411235 RepID=UPI0034E2C1E7
MADIGEAVGIVPSGVYRHFESKTEILVTAATMVASGCWPASTRRSPGRRTRPRRWSRCSAHTTPRTSSTGT